VLTFSSPSISLLTAELERSFPDLQRAGPGFTAPHQDALARVLRRAAELAHSLPDQAAQDFEARLALELEQLPGALRGTEVERLVRLRVGQQAFRRAMLDYWGGACAVTGIAMPAILRASHAKPWAECSRDSERLDVYNGFLLSANLDALFDAFLISFSDEGVLLVSPSIGHELRESLGLDRPLRLRWLAAGHLPYLQYHLARFGS